MSQPISLASPIIAQQKQKIISQLS
ncbi:hypothetical protein GASC598I20_005680, partial [Gilliamella apicola SCGC AB-598-I20]